MSVDVAENKLGRPLLIKVAATSVRSGLPVLDLELTGMNPEIN